MGAFVSDSLLIPPDADLDPRAITQKSGSNFLLGFVCLDKARRQAMMVIYAFCRVVDDAVDDAPDVATGRARLAFWQQELSRCDDGAPQTPVGQALAQAVRDFSIPTGALEDLIEDLPDTAQVARQGWRDREIWVEVSAGWHCLLASFGSDRAWRRTVCLPARPGLAVHQRIARPAR